MHDIVPLAESHHWENLPKPETTEQTTWCENSSTGDCDINESRNRTHLIEYQNIQKYLSQTLCLSKTNLCRFCQSTFKKFVRMIIISFFSSEPLESFRCLLKCFNTSLHLWKMFAVRFPVPFHFVLQIMSPYGIYAELTLILYTVLYYHERMLDSTLYWSFKFEFILKPRTIRIRSLNFMQSSIVDVKYDKMLEIFST